MRRRICLWRDSGIVDLLGLGVEGAEGRQRRHEHSHRMGVVVEPVHEALAHVLVNERVVGDLVGPRRQLLLIGQLAVEQQIGDLEVGGVVGELLDRIAAVAEDAGVAVEVGDLRFTRGRRQECRVVHEQVRVELAERRRREDPVGDRNRHRLAGAVVGDRDGVGHVFPSRSRCQGLPPCSRRVLPISAAAQANAAGYTSNTPTRGRALLDRHVFNTARCRVCGVAAAHACRKASNAAATAARVSPGSITAST